MFSRLSPKLLVLTVIISFLVIVISIDRLIIGKAYFFIPNELGWDTSPWYNFLHKRYHINFSKKEKGILITGSSVALYSALPGPIQNRLNQNSNEKYKIKFYSHVAMSPVDFYFYVHDMIDRAPKKILYLINPADFQMDHLIDFSEIICRNPDCIGGYTIPVFSENMWAKAYSHRSPTRMLYPFSFLKEQYTYLSKKEIITLLSKSFLKINSYRNFFFDPLDALYERHIRRGRSYHTYMGAVPEEGIWREGWTTTSFKIDCELDQGELYHLIYITRPNTKIQVYYKGKLISESIFKKKGWRNLRVKLNENLSRAKLSFNIDKPVLSNVVDPKQYGKVYTYGIRLSQNFCRKKFDRNISYIREDFLDEHRFEEMTLEEYKKDYFERLYKDACRPNEVICKRPETIRMNMLHRHKLELTNIKFNPWIEFKYLKKGIALALKNNIEVILINNPENPLELNRYKDSSWYNGYIKYLSEISDDKLFRFYDWKDKIGEPRKFIDPHHLTLPGSIEMTDLYVNILK